MLKLGIPQGGNFIPLIENTYLDILNKGVISLKPWPLEMVRFTDNYVIIVKPEMEKTLLVCKENDIRDHA